MRDSWPPAGSGSSRSPPPSRRRSRGACCSATSRRSCTRATTRSPSAGPPRCALDQGLLAELLGRAELRELLDPDALAELERELQRLAEDRKARDAEGVADLLRLLGPLSHRRGRRPQPPTARAGLAGAAARRPARRRVRMGGDGRAGRAVEDVGRLRDGLGVPVPPGTPDAFAEPVEDPLGRPGRPLRPHPRPVHDGRRGDPPRARRRRGPPDPPPAGGRRAACSRASSDPPAAARSGATPRCCAGSGDARLAALRKEVEPVEPATLGRFLPAWQNVARRRGTRGALRGVDGVLTVVDQLAGCAVPASALEPLVLGSRVVDYRPAMLDELTVDRRGAVGRARHPARHRRLGVAAPGRHRPPHPPRPRPSRRRRPRCTRRCWTRSPAAVPTSSGSSRPRRPGRRAPTDDRALEAALWDLVWAGRLTNDTLAPVRAADLGGRTAHRSAAAPPRARRAAATPGVGRADLPSRTGPPTIAGRWSLLPELEPDATRRAHAVGRGPARAARRGHPRRGRSASACPAASPGVYKVLSAFEDSGRCRRGYFVAWLGAAQFGVPGAVDRLRSFSRERPTSLGRDEPRRGRRREPSRWPPPTRPTPTARRCPGPSGSPADGSHRRPPTGPQGGRPGGAGRRRARGLRRARRHDPADLQRRRRPPRRPPLGALATAVRAGGARPAHGRAGRRRAASSRRASGPAPCGRRSRTPASSRRRAGCGCAGRPRAAVPEGDTVWRTARHLDQALSGQVLTAHRLPGARPRHPRPAPAGASSATVARGKHLLTRIGADHTLHTHLKMEGAWHLYRPEHPVAAAGHEARVVLARPSLAAVGFALGIVEVLARERGGRRGRPPRPRPARPRLGPEEAVRRLLADPDAARRRALLDQRNLAGIGNLYKSELCFLAGVHPWRPVGEVGDLPRAGAPRPRGARGQQGARRADHHRRHPPRAADLGLPARQAALPACGTAIRSDQGPAGTRERATYWCPSCQPEAAEPQAAEATTPWPSRLARVEGGPEPDVLELHRRERPPRARPRR